MRQVFKPKKRWYWPEIHTYCGCCSLRTGIYIRTVITMIINFISLASNAFVLYYMLSASRRYSNPDYARYPPEDRFQLPDFSEMGLETAITAYKILFGYYLAWVFLKAAYALMMLVMLYGVLKKKGKILKIYLYVIVPYWAFDVIISSLGAIVSSFWLKFLLLLALLSEGYNLLAISTEYKVITGKSMIAPDFSSADMETMTECDEESTVSIQVNESQSHTEQRHCCTCTCQLGPSNNPVNEESTVNQEIPTTSTAESTITQNNERPKTLNFKDADIIFDEDQMLDLDTPVLAERRYCVVDNGFTANEVDEDKETKMDEPVIYDDSQLNVGTSPVIEDRPFIISIVQGENRQ